MVNLDWLVRGTCEGMRLDLNLQATHYLAAWALPDECIDHSVSYRGVIELGFSLDLTPMAHAGVVNRCNFVIHFVRKVLLRLQG